MVALKSTVGKFPAWPRRLRGARDFYGQYGAREFANVLLYRKVTRHTLRMAARPARRRLSEALKARRGSTVVMVGTRDWNYRYLQRQHHFARALSRLGHNVVYVIPGHGFDRPWSFCEPEPGILVTPHLHAALEAVERPTAYVISTDVRRLRPVYEFIQRAGGHLIYDYLDHLDSGISNAPVTETFRRQHRAVLADEQACTVLASADILLCEAAGVRTRRLALVTNGVDPAHFNVERDAARLLPKLRRIVAKAKPVIGYFGALASWLDLDLVARAARLRPQFEFVLMGPPCDASPMDQVSLPGNLSLLGAVPYEQLPSQAAFFDVLTVPFKLNDITAATSPLKLFEYMALGRPIVSTPIAESLKYDCVLTADGAPAFAARLDDALALAQDKTYLKGLADCATANSWEAKARVISQLLDDQPAARSHAPEAAPMELAPCGGKS